MQRAGAAADQVLAALEGATELHREVTDARREAAEMFHHITTALGAGAAAVARAAAGRVLEDMIVDLARLDGEIDGIIVALGSGQPIPEGEIQGSAGGGGGAELEQLDHQIKLYTPSKDGKQVQAVEKGAGTILNVDGAAQLQADGLSLTGGDGAYVDMNDGNVVVNGGIVKITGGVIFLN